MDDGQKATTFVALLLIPAAFMVGVLVQDHRMGKFYKDAGIREGRAEALYDVRADAVSGYLNCLDEPPACDAQKQTWLDVQRLSDPYLIELEKKEQKR
jgi:hypothetical protein